MLNYDLNKNSTKKRKVEFAQQLMEIQDQIDFKMSSRGWCYFFENMRVINKDQFKTIEKIINDCRKLGFIPVDFVAEDEGRAFSGIEIPKTESPISYMGRYIKAVLECEKYYTPDWWEDEEYYIQMVVEKIDLKTLFEPVCKKYHIPIATSKGWASIFQRADYARRFKEAEEKGLKTVLLYCGDFDPVGLKISDILRKNLADVENCIWSDNQDGYDPQHLIIERFGLNYDFIIEHNLSWIENLITSGSKDLSDPEHRHYNREYVQKYIKQYGVRKCEANAIVIIPDKARELCENAIIRYFGPDALKRFEEKKSNVESILNDFRDENDINSAMLDILRLIEDQRN